MRKKPPCKPNGIDCPDRRPGCQDKCETMIKWKAEIDAENVARADAKEIEWLMTSQSARRGEIGRLKEGKK